MHIQARVHEHVDVRARTRAIRYVRTVIDPFMQMRPKFRPIRARVSAFHTGWDFGPFENSMSMSMNIQALVDEHVHLRARCTRMYSTLRRDSCSPFYANEPKISTNHSSSVRVSHWLEFRRLWKLCVRVVVHTVFNYAKILSIVKLEISGHIGEFSENLVGVHVAK